MDPRTNTAQPPDPVYKERLQVKYLKATRKKPSLDVSRWRFLNDISDDDDDDDPPQPSESRGGISPVDLNSKARTKTAGRAKISVSKELDCFSRLSATQRTGRAHVAAVERKLLQHPLGLYEHYEQHMPPELFEQVLSVLDPDMCVNSKPKTPVMSEHVNDGESPDHWLVDGDQDSTPANENNPGTQAPRPHEQNVGLQDNVAQDDEYIGKMTRDTALGSEPGDNYPEKRPTVCFPSQVSKADDLPDDRQNTFTGTCRQPTTDLSKHSTPTERKAGSKKPVYDARYQDPRTKKSTAAETVQDPNVQLQFQNQTRNKDGEYRQMFAFQAFRQYLISNRLRVPEFMNEIFSEGEEATAVRTGGRPDT